MAAVLKKRALAEYSTVIQDQPPTKQIKKLRLVKKSRLGGSAAAYVGLLEKCKSSNEALQLLLRISDSLHFQEDELGEMVRKLAEHYHDQAESAVRVKVLALFGDIGSEPGANVKGIMNETIEMMKNETSHKVLTQALATLLKLGKVIGDNTAVQLELVNIAKQYLSDTSHSVKRKCLDLIGEMVALGDGSSEGGVTVMFKLVGDYTHSQDPRVRSAAFKTMLTMHERGLTVDAAIYSNTCQALSDDYEVVRQSALKLVWLIGTTYPENLIVLEDGEQEVRLVDDVFGKICSSVTDLSMAVRTQACRLLGSMTQVSDKFLQQTLDKKLMSNMRQQDNTSTGQFMRGLVHQVIAVENTVIS